QTGGFFMEYDEVAILIETNFMAEITNQTSQNKNKRTQCNKRSTKVDLTPMVDLGFILITFFVFTAALTDAKAMNLLLPNDSDTAVNDAVCESCALTFILEENNQLYYYEGKEENAQFKTSNYSSRGIRQLILGKRKQVIQKMGKDQMVLLIKPAAKSSFKNLIDVVDECNISLVKRYYIDEITDPEKNGIKEITPPIVTQ
ncbi:MAG TPA: biopolymer transporter ExbD, partial [Ferruginibacter sp.]|nr:biopolymer transporter ExbD [Ferruginibacter sp.]